MSDYSVVISSAYLPPLSYCLGFIGKEKLIIDTHEFFVKQTIRNRCYIASANGLLPLIIPVMHQNRQRTPMKDVRISNDTNWQKIHWKSIETAYRNSPFFEYYEDYFHEFYFQKHEFLFEYNLAIMNRVMMLLKIDKRPEFSEEYIKNVETGKKILDLRNSEVFDRKNIPDKFSRLPYQQVFSNKQPFLPDLSIIDLLSNTGPNTLEYLNNLYLSNI